MSTNALPQTFLGGRVIVKVGDITVESVDAIVNAANSSLLGGGGVDGAIHRRGGKAILDACKKLRHDQFPDGLPTGQAVATTAGRLPAQYVIHTVGPVWHGGNKGEPEALGNCYTESLRAACAKGARTIAFPAISTGIYRFPKDFAARISSEVIKAYLDANDAIEEVTLVFFSGSDAATFLTQQKFND